MEGKRARDEYDRTNYDSEVIKELNESLQDLKGLLVEDPLNDEIQKVCWIGVFTSYFDV